MSVDVEGATHLYDEATALMRRIFQQAEQNEPIDGKEIAELVWRLVEHMTLGDKGLVYFTNRSTPRNYFIAQSVNVCILSLLVGGALGYDTSKLHELGVAALLHDIGMVKVLKIATQPRKLTPEELEEIRKHPTYGVQILQKIDLLHESTLFVCREHRRRKWGKAPASPSEKLAREYAQIVGTIDIYVAMTQPRPYREAKLSHEAVRELIGTALEIFDTRVMKTLINQIGIYPIGSWVKLNTEEIARVVGQNQNFPLHPIVEILFDPKGHFLETTKTYDLFKQQILYIKEPVDYQKLQLSGKE
ncbi:MAG: HD domain-containing protein [Candidatus Omnitrophica bacterium]|nr:HD domain-containing protein [Candidatus Omnitrophota bacterium]